MKNIEDIQQLVGAKVDGIFGINTARAIATKFKLDNSGDLDDVVKRIQKYVGASIDGVFGPISVVGVLAKLDHVSNHEPVSVSGSKLPERLVNVAKTQVGVRESGNNSGKDIAKYQSATWLPVGKWAWCAAFVCWCVEQAIQGLNVSFKRPETAGAWDFESWADEQNSTVNLRKPHNDDIKAGDIVVFRFSHIGIATSEPDADGYVKTIEGNTNGAGSREGDGVYAKQRHVSQIRSRIRFI